MAGLIDPTASFSNAFNSAQNVTDTFRRNMAFKALESTYGPIVGDMKLATDVQAYEQNKLLNPLEVEAKQLANESTRDTNAFNAANRPLVLEGNQIANETGQFNLDQGRNEADRAETIRQAQQAHTTLTGVLDSVETNLKGVVDPNQRLAVFDNQVRQLAPLIGADADQLLHSLAQQRAAVAAQGDAAIGPMRQQLDDMLYAGLDPKQRQELVNAGLQAEQARASIEKTKVDTAKTQGEVDAKAAEKVDKAKTAARALDAYEAKNTELLANIDKAIQIARSSPLATGVLSEEQAKIGFGPAADLAATLDSVKARVGFEELQQMRDNSPTGGSLGQVSDTENRLLQSAIQSVTQKQRAGQLIGNLTRLRNYIVQGEERVRAAYEDDFAGVEITVDGTGVPTGDGDGEVVDYTDYFGAQ